jgi:hypothetical protein
LGGTFLPGKTGGGDFFFLQDAKGCESFAARSEEVGHIGGDFFAGLVGPAGECIGVHLGQDLGEGQVHEPGVFGGGVDEDSGGGVAAEFAEADFYGAVGQLFEDTLSGYVVVGASDAGGGEFAPEFLRDQLDDGRVRHDEGFPAGDLPRGWPGGGVHPGCLILGQ